jgi:signal transduction histidine kinase
MTQGNRAHEARRSIQPGGVAWAKPLAEAGRIEFKVADTGVGMPRESLPVIVEQFRQSEHYMTRAHGGIGLGLYMVKNLSELIGVAIDVDSEFGKDSTFQFPYRARLCPRWLEELDGSARGFHV